MIYIEYLHLSIENKHKWNYHIFIGNSIGYFLYFVSALYYEDYNKGKLYTFAAYFIMISTGFKITIKLITSQKTMTVIIE